MKTWYSKILDYWDELVAYGFTVVCVFLGDYILHGTRPEIGFLPFVGSLVVAALICLAVEVLTGAADTDVKKAAKKKALPKRLLVSGAFGLASSAFIPVLIKSLAAGIGIDL